MGKSEQVVRQIMMTLPHFDYEVPVLYVTGGEAYVPMIALCEMLGLHVETHVQRWRKLLLAEEVRKLPVRIHGRRKRPLWCVNMEVMPFLYSDFDWALVSPERRVRLRRAAQEWLERLGQAHRTMQDRYKETRAALFSILTTHADDEATLKDYAQRLHVFLDDDSCTRLDQLIAHGCVLIQQATTHARAMLHDQIDNPVIDAFTIDPYGNVVEARSLPLLPVMPEKDNEQLLESMTQLVQWYEDFAAFLEEFFASEPE